MSWFKNGQKAHGAGNPKPPCNNAPSTVREQTQAGWEHEKQQEEIRRQQVGKK